METVAAFDFDGTLSYKDVLVPFLIFKNGRVKTLIHLLSTLPYFIAFIGGLVSRTEVKEALLTRALKGIPSEELKKSAETFAAGPLKSHLRPERMEFVHQHRAKGDHTVIVSANLDLFLAPWAKANGFEGCLATQLAEEEGKITGRLLGPNCWGEEKVKRFQAWAEKEVGPREEYLLVVYGDSLGDEPLLKFADRATRF